MPHRTTRRSFLAQVGAVGAAGAAMSFAVPRIARAKSPNGELNVGFVAVGGRAGAHTGAAHKMKLNCVCFAEVDKSRWSGVLNKEGWKNAAGYTDWRKMFEKHAKDLDVVFVATPDHSHFAPSMTAYEFIKGGAIGDVLEFHTWTNRPIWPQGGDRPEGEDPIPENLDWDSWIGPAPMRPFKKDVYHSFKWRGFVDFGSGALGDMACHTTDGIYAIMAPGYAATAEPIFMTAPCKDQFPSGMTIKATYRAKDGRPGFTTFWYEGKKADRSDNMPEVPEELKADKRKLPRTGNYVIGSKGKLLIEGDY